MIFRGFCRFREFRGINLAEKEAQKNKREALNKGGKFGGQQ